MRVRQILCGIFIFVGFFALSAPLYAMTIEKYYDGSVDPNFEGPTVLEFTFQAPSGEVMTQLLILGMKYDPAKPLPDRLLREIKEYRGHHEGNGSNADFHFYLEQGQELPESRVTRLKNAGINFKILRVPETLPEDVVELSDEELQRLPEESGESLPEAVANFETELRDSEAMQRVLEDERFRGAKLISVVEKRNGRKYLRRKHRERIFSQKSTRHHRNMAISIGVMAGTATAVVSFFNPELSTAQQTALMLYNSVFAGGATYLTPNITAWAKTDRSRWSLNSEVPKVTEVLKRVAVFGTALHVGRRLIVGETESTAPVISTEGWDFAIPHQLLEKFDPALTADTFTSLLGNVAGVFNATGLIQVGSILAVSALGEAVYISHLTKKVTDPKNQMRLFFGGVTVGTVLSLMSGVGLDGFSYQIAEIANADVSVTGMNVGIIGAYLAMAGSLYHQELRDWVTMQSAGVRLAVANMKDRIKRVKQTKWLNFKALRKGLSKARCINILKEKSLLRWRKTPVE